MKTISVESIVLKDNARAINPETLKRTLLYHSIRKEGRVKVPILVYKKDGEIVVWDGAQRVTAARLLEIAEVPYVEVPPPADAGEEASAQIIYNNCRSELSYTERARLIQRMRDGGLAQKEIADKIGESEAEISIALRVMGSHPKIRAALDAGRISPSAVEPLVTQPFAVQEALADTAIRTKTVRGVRALVNAHKLQRDAAIVVEEQDSEDVDPLEVLVLDDLEEALKHLQAAQETGLTNPVLQRRGRKSVAEIVQIAVSLGEAWTG